MKFGLSAVAALCFAGAAYAAETPAAPPTPPTPPAAPASCPAFTPAPAAPAELKSAKAAIAATDALNAWIETTQAAKECRDRIQVSLTEHSNAIVSYANGGRTAASLAIAGQTEIPPVPAYPETSCPQYPPTSTLPSTADMKARNDWVVNVNGIYDCFKKEVAAIQAKKAGVVAETQAAVDSATAAKNDLQAKLDAYTAKHGGKKK